MFLDNINRKQISKTLLGFGLQKQDYQFIFIRLVETGKILATFILIRLSLVLKELPMWTSAQVIVAK